MTIPLLTRITAGGPAGSIDFNLICIIAHRAPANGDKATRFRRCRPTTRCCTGRRSRCCCVTQRSKW